MLASLLYPYDVDAPKLIDGWLKELQNQSCIVRYVVDRKFYIQICNWSMHQKIDRPSKPRFPPLDDSSRGLDEDSRVLDEDSLKTRCGIEDQGSRIKDQGRDQGSKRATNARPTQASDFPNWLPLDVWNAFVEMRKKIRAPLTARAITLLIRELERLKLSGHDPTAVLNQSIMKSWRGVFEINQTGAKDNGNRYQTARDRQREDDRKAIEYLRQQAARDAVQGRSTDS